MHGFGAYTAYWARFHYCHYLPARNGRAISRAPARLMLTLIYWPPLYIALTCSTAEALFNREMIY